MDCSDTNNDMKQMREICFTVTRSLQYVPPLSKKISFPMAFLCCQSRYVEKDPVTNEISNISESPTHKLKTWNICNSKSRDIQNSCFDFIDISDDFDPDRFNQWKQSMPNYIDQDGRLRLFYPIKNSTENQAHPHRFCTRDFNVGENFHLDLYKDKEQLSTWIEMAEFIHSYVIKKSSRQVNLNDIDEVIKAYGSVFKVNISIRSFQRNGEIIKRYYYPSKLNSAKYISIMMDEDNHFHAVTNLRDLFKTIYNKSIDTHSYCDSCDKIESYSVDESVSFCCNSFKRPIFMKRAQEVLNLQIVEHEAKKVKLGNDYHIKYLKPEFRI